MFQVRIHGRGGQGVVSAAEMLSIAAFMENRWAQAFPAFGSERKGAPVTAFCRISENEIRLREPVIEPDALIIQDPTLLSQINVLEGLRPRGYVLINSERGGQRSPDATDRHYAIDYAYCKGCGLCAVECPCGAIRMEPETI